MKAMKIIVLVGSIVLVFPFMLMLIQATVEGYEDSVLHRLISSDEED